MTMAMMSLRQASANDVFDRLVFRAARRRWKVASRPGLTALMSSSNTPPV